MPVEHQSLPDTDRLSVVAASILLAYSLLPFVTLPDQTLNLNILGVHFSYGANFSTVIALLSGGMAAAGISWLLGTHPRLAQPGASDATSWRGLIQHTLLPALTAWVLVVPLNSLKVGSAWWIAFGFGGLLLVLVLVAEYVAVDPADTRYGLAMMGLTAVAYALFLILTITLAARGTRLYIMLPSLGGGLFLMALRTLHLRLGGRWCVAWSLAIALVIVQAAAALHYWPLSPLRFGLVILGLAYAMISAAGAIEEGRSWRTLWIEPASMLAVLWGLAIGIRG